MGFSFNFFGESSHRDFNYKPRYYDPEAEERRRMFKDKDTDAKDEEYTPGKYLKGSFTDGGYRRTKLSSTNKAQKLIGMMGLILFFCVLYYIAKFYGIILG